MIDDNQRRAISELCRRLDGLPLALELAASRVRALTPVELVANLEERFRMLIGGRRSRMERHQTMRGTLDWSYELCSEVEQVVFDRLSVFPAGLDLSAARAVAGGDGVDEFDVVDLVPQLVDRSLLQRATAADGTTRYRMLETMRAYGREHLQHQDLSDTIRERHARYVARTIGELSLRILGPDEEQVVRRLNEYLPDALVALDWCIDHKDWDAGIRVIWAGRRTAEREVFDMATRLLDAARAGGAPDSLIAELECMDLRETNTGTLDDDTELAWRRIRSHAPIPSDRYVVSPYISMEVTAADVDEYLASLERWRSAPGVNRYYTEYFALRSLVFSPEVTDHVDERLAPFAVLAASLDSKWASVGVAELNGLLAAHRHDWPAAANWYRQARADGAMRWYLDLAAGFHLLTAQAMSGAPFELAGADLREPWRFYRDQNFIGFRWLGATATAVAVHRIGHVDLADRLAAWPPGPSNTIPTGTCLRMRATSSAWPDSRRHPAGATTTLMLSSTRCWPSPTGSTAWTSSRTPNADQARPSARQAIIAGGDGSGPTASPAKCVPSPRIALADLGQRSVIKVPQGHGYSEHHGTAKRGRRQTEPRTRASSSVRRYGPPSNGCRSGIMERTTWAVPGHHRRRHDREYAC